MPPQEKDMVDTMSPPIFPQTYGVPQPQAPPPRTEGDPPLVLSPAEALPADTRFQRTMIGMGGAFSVMMAASNRMPDMLSRVTKMPRTTIDQIRCGAAHSVSLQELCILADALGCEVEVRLTQRPLIR